MIVRNTQYGFQWGPLTVLRACSDKRYYTLLIQAGKRTLQVSASAKGGKLYVHTERPLKKR